MQKPGASAEANGDLLSMAAFVPSGDDILLTFPRTTHSILVLRASGQDRSIHLDIPGGFVLHDVLGSDGRITLVARGEALPKAETKPSAPPLVRLLDFNLSSGALNLEYISEKVPLSAVTCAAKLSLTAVYLDDIGSPVKQDPIDPMKPVAAGQPKQLDVSTVRR